MKTKTTEYKKFFVNKKPKYFLTKEELKKITERHTSKPWTKEQYLEFKANAKMLKWDRKHPYPKMPEVNKDDMFINDSNLLEEFNEKVLKYKEERKVQLEYAMEYCKTICDKLNLYVRYEGQMAKEPYPIKIAEIKDKDRSFSKAEKTVDLTTANSKTMRKAQKLTNQEKKKNVKLIATKLSDIKKNKHRIILPQEKLLKAA